jgi:hypothetical protein
MGRAGWRVGTLNRLGSRDDCFSLARGAVMASRKNNQIGIIILKNAASVRLKIKPAKK